MNAYEYLSKCPSFSVIRKKFPDFVEFSKEVEVIPWEEEFAVADYNPEVAKTLRFLHELWKMKALSNEEYEKELKQFENEYSSLTLGVAFIEEKRVSFRFMPPEEHVVVHEVGHCYFQAHDRVWNSVYCGGETLFWTIIARDLPLNELSIFEYHAWLEDILSGNQEKVEKKILSKLSKLSLPIYPHILTYALWMGSILSDRIPPELFEDLQSSEWSKVVVQKQDLISFLDNVILGTYYGDPTAQVFLMSLFR